MFWLLYSTYCNLILVLCSITTCIYYVFPRLQEQQRAAPCVTISSLSQSELRMRSECGRSFAVVSVENSWQRLTWWTGSRPSGNGCFHNVWRIILTELEVSGNPGAAKGKPCVLSWFPLSSFGWAAGDIQKRWKVASEVNVSEPKQTLRGEAAEQTNFSQCGEQPLYYGSVAVLSPARSRFHRVRAPLWPPASQQSIYILSNVPLHAKIIKEKIFHNLRDP